MIKRSFFLFFALFVLLNLQAQLPKLKTGDFLFQDLDCGPLCDAIENATFHDKNYKISHVGIVLVEKDSVFVLEAYDGVTKTPLQKFLKRSVTKEEKPLVVIARLKPEYQKHIPAFIKRLKTKIGLSYDTEFKLFNNKYYCSELIYENLLDTTNKPIFTVKPMTFKNKKTHKTDLAWVNYFKEQNIAIPEGALGCNPADYLVSDRLQILVFMY